jgi:hypothetical protein
MKRSSLPVPVWKSMVEEVSKFIWRSILPVKANVTGIAGARSWGEFARLSINSFTEEKNPSYTPFKSYIIRVSNVPVLVRSMSISPHKANAPPLWVMYLKKNKLLIPPPSYVDHSRTSKHHINRISGSSNGCWGLKLYVPYSIATRTEKGRDPGLFYFGLRNERNARHSCAFLSVSVVFSFIFYLYLECELNFNWVELCFEKWKSIGLGEVESEKFTSWRSDVIVFKERRSWKFKPSGSYAFFSKTRPLSRSRQYSSEHNLWLLPSLVR